MPFVLRWAIAFAFTQMVEAPIYAAAIGEARATRERWTIALAASLLTHPIVWFVLPDVVPLLAPEASPWWAIAVAELFAVSLEAGWLAAFRVRRALLLALLANGTSFTLGLFAYVHLAW